MNQRAEEMLKEYASGLTLHEVSKKFGVTRERVRQIITGLKGYEAVKENNRNDRKESLLTGGFCPQCGEAFQYYKSAAIPKFCSKKCFSASVRKKWEEMKERTCTKCHKTKPITQFHRLGGGRRGYFGACKACHKKLVVAWQLSHPEKNREMQRRAVQKWQNNPDNKQKMYESNKRRYWSNPEKYRARSNANHRKHYAENAEARRADQKMRERVRVEQFKADLEKKLLTDSKGLL